MPYSKLGLTLCQAGGSKRHFPLPRQNAQQRNGIGSIESKIKISSASMPGKKSGENGDIFTGLAVKPLSASMSAVSPQRQALTNSRNGRFFSVRV
jgi:hypothetical protein